MRTNPEASAAAMGGKLPDMLYRRLGRTNLRVSELGYGAARGAVENRQQFISTVKSAIAAGINFVDTAADYEDGASEEALGEALRGHDDVIVETKYRPYDGWAPAANYTGSPGALVASVERSLRRLRRDHVDILLGHGIRTLESLDRFMSDGCWDAMVRLRDQGKCVVFSTHIMREAERLCDRIAIMHRGRILAEGTLDQLRGQHGQMDLEELFYQLISRREEQYLREQELAAGGPLPAGKNR